MTSRDFCYWLQGHFELSGDAPLTPEQTATVRAHLALVFAHEIDPSHGTPEHVDDLREIHDGTRVPAPKAPPKDSKRAREIRDLLESRHGQSIHDLKLMC